ncbi:DNA polymerase I [Parvibaculum sp.]|uniref:DNA polymerase I n=1 Tax=Parvibaculum sp. TaxID=2024848 RepID=UPI001B0AA2AA|nr:DNA polymerase I [Parvibaculum sp.]MBO6633537.1 DNA polymerase I [Parvibaculum sp.]MBO6677703.1 DNA polymerase I [Parvibaculum sp.]MBO6685391.1 DNA polymerase I [Parvibaculum sp.]MBO6903376.1 DNA polymerase I [Parvibaculum sp.]
MKNGDHLFLVDGSGYIFRAYHALPPLTRKSDGLPIGAVAGFCNMLYKLIEDTKDEFEPTHLAVIFDASSKTFRNDIYPEYKANRLAPPEDLVPQFALVRDATRAFGVPCIEKLGFEADDLIATYARLAHEAGARVTIVSSDKDLMQLVNEQVDMLDTMKMKTIAREQVIEKFGVPPEKVVDVQALAGDSTDNVPGVPGIGVKTAAQLIGEYGDLETLLARASEIKQNKRRENLIEFAEQARISRRLVELDNNVPVEEPLEEMGVRDPDPETLIGFFKDMEFNTLTRRVGERFNIDVDAIPASGEHPPEEAAPQEKQSVSRTARGGAPGATPKGIDLDFREANYVAVTTLPDLEEWIARAREQGFFAVDTETDSLAPMQARLVGVSMSLVPGEACYIPLQHGAGGGLDFADAEGQQQIPLGDALKALKPLLEDPGILKIGQNLKFDILVFWQHGIELRCIDDTMLMSYALDAGVHGHGMDELSELHLNHKPIAFSEVAGKGKSQITFDQVPVDRATAYAAEDADVTLRLWHILKPRLVGERRATVYETLERPLVKVLAGMERAGVKVDKAVLARLSADFAQKMARYEEEIYEIAGERFNIASPKQLGEILFDKQSLEGGRKTKTGAWSTDADTLEMLAAQGHDLPQRVLDWRGLSKLKSTYTDTLPEYIDPDTGRVHTSYSLASTSTGRLASTEPNLQNIPVRTEDGRKIRTAFIAEKGNLLISADYSQIELRLLAHIADIEALKKAFADGLDIHAMTASEMFNTPIEGMDPSVRRRAKAINFGIIYGISAFGLANQLGIARSEAGEYIDRYFKRFPGIRAYMDDTKEFAHKNGYVETIFGRRIHLPAINSKNPAEKSFMERAAINAPIQGSAADIIRRAMIRMPQALADAKLSARMLLQVHDELIFEVPEKEAKKTSETVSGVMSSAAAPALELSVPLDVDARAAKNWDEAH